MRLLLLLISCAYPPANDLSDSPITHDLATGVTGLDDTLGACANAAIERSGWDDARVLLALADQHSLDANGKFETYTDSGTGNETFAECMVIVKSLNDDRWGMVNLDGAWYEPAPTDSVWGTDFDDELADEWLVDSDAFIPDLELDYSPRVLVGDRDVVKNVELELGPTRASLSSSFYDGLELGDAAIVVLASRKISDDVWEYPTYLLNAETGAEVNMEVQQNPP